MAFITLIAFAAPMVLMALMGLVGPHGLIVPGLWYNQWVYDLWPYGS